VTKSAKSYYRFRKRARRDPFGSEPVTVGLTDAGGIYRDRPGPHVELRIGEGKDVRIAWLTSTTARQVGYGLLVAAAEVQARKKRRRRT
jgi:hypothetical protein